MEDWNRAYRVAQYVYRRRTKRPLYDIEPKWKDLKKAQFEVRAMDYYNEQYPSLQIRSIRPESDLGIVRTMGFCQEVLGQYLRRYERADDRRRLKTLDILMKNVKLFFLPLLPIRKSRPAGMQCLPLITEKAFNKARGNLLEWSKRRTKPAGASIEFPVLTEAGTICLCQRHSERRQ